VTPATQRRGATCAALGATACAGLLVLWTDARDPPTTRPAVQSDRGDDGVRAFAASEPSQTKSRRSTSRVDSDPSTDETGIGNRDALAALVVALGDADANVRVDAVSDLGLFSDTQTESLLAITAMQDPAAAVRVEALYALGSLRAEPQLATLRHALDDPDKDVRNTAVSALEELGGSASAELLRVALSDRDAAVRAAAAEALADFRTAR
jgi:HEAT repeat protein